MPLGDPAGRLTSHFERRMFVVALLTGVLVAALAPIAHGVVAWRALRVTAQAHADELARAVAEVAARQPYLWPYNVPKVVLATDGAVRHEALASVAVHGCGGEVRIATEELGYGPASSGPMARSAISIPGGVVGWVEVTPSVAAVRATRAALIAVGTLVGAFLALALFLVPTRFVRRQYAEIATVTGRLRSAEAELRRTNADLEERVAAAVADARRLSERVVRVQEEERTRFARDLHDSLGQHLTAQRLELDRDVDDPARLERLRALNDALWRDLRRALDDLRPAELEEASLAAALSSLTESFELRTGIPTSLRARGIDEVDERVATTVFRIVQEALNNVARHADAGEVGVRCERDDSGLIIEVRDDGVGGAADGNGHGIRSMQDRAHYIAGDFGLRSRRGEGTTVTVRIPPR